MRAFVLFSFLAAVFAEPQGYNYQHQHQQQQSTFPINLSGIGGGSFGGHGSSHATSQATSHSSSHSHSTGGIAQESQSFLQEALQNTKLMQMLLEAPRPINSYIPPPQSPQNFYQAPPQQQQHQHQQPQQLQQQQHQQQQQHHHHQQSFSYSAPQQSYHTQVPATASAPLSAPNFAPLPQYQSPAPSAYYPQQYQQQSYNQPSQGVTKDIYVHVAPEEQEFGQHAAPVLPPPPPRKHYRIVFIKAPTPKINTAALRLRQAPSEEKTIIYVLTKRPDPLELEAAIQEAPTKPPSKPEVYFIKYKTQAEAQHAQRTIQAQYDQLGGTTQVSDEGVAPVTSVIGALDGQKGSAGSSTGTGFGSSGAGHSLGSTSGTSSYSNGISSGASSSSSSSGSNGSSNFSKYLPPIVRI